MTAVPFERTPVRAAEERIVKFLEGKGKEKTDQLRQDHAIPDDGVRFGVQGREGLKKGIEEIQGLKERFREAAVTDHGKSFNYELVETIELGHQLDLSEVILLSALHRQESRGAHCRMDFPKRDDQDYLKHTLVFQAPAGLEVDINP